MPVGNGSRAGAGLGDGKGTSDKSKVAATISAAVMLLKDKHRKLPYRHVQGNVQHSGQAI